MVGHVRPAPPSTPSPGVAQGYFRCRLARDREPYLLKATRTGRQGTAGSTPYPNFSKNQPMRRRHRIAGGLLIVLISGLVGCWLWQRRVERSQDRPIAAAARRYQVEPALVKAVVWRESRFNPRARGQAEEIGLMQIREDAAREWADAEQVAGFEHTHCFDPGTNTLAGTWYLKKLLKRYIRTDNPAVYALADYNAGRGNVLKWCGGAASTNSTVFLEQIGFPGTREYVRSVLERYARYRSIFRSAML